MEDDITVGPLVQYVHFLTDKEEFKGLEVLYDQGSPIAYLGDRNYAVSEDDCKIFYEKGIQYRILGAAPAAAV